MISLIHPSPIGPLTLISNGAALTHLEFEHPRYPFAPAPSGHDAILDQARRELDRYFSGTLHLFTVAVAPQGTSFQQRVWTALRDIPYGVTRSYAQQAVAIGAPQAARAVGAANGRNPISVIIPCHRVIGASGALTGYGGGVARKTYLLDLEQGQAAEPLLITKRQRL